MTQAASPALPSARMRGLTLILIIFGTFIVYLDSTVVGVALPDIQGSFGVGLRSLQWVSDIYLLAFGCLQLAAGTIGDSFGHRRLFILGLIGFTILSVVCAITGSIEWLLAGRALQGVFGAVLIPVSLAMIRSLYAEPAKRAKAIGIWSGFGGVALAAGPVLGGWLVDSFGWESVFWLNVPIGIIVSALLIAMKSQEPALRRRKLDGGGQLSFIAFISLLAYALIEGNARGWDSALIIGMFAGSALALILFILWELRAKEPMFPLQMLRHPVIAAGAVVNFLGFFGLYAVIFLLVLFWQQTEGLSPTEAGVRFLSMNASIMLFSYLGSSWAPKIPPRIAQSLGSLVIAVALGGLCFLHANDPYFSYAWALALLGFGVAFVGTSATVAVMGSMPPERAGAASGMLNTARQASAIFGVALAGALLASHISASAPDVLAKIGAEDSVKQQLLRHWNTGMLDKGAAELVPSDAWAALSRESVRLFEEGMHLTMAVSALAGAIGGLIIYLLFVLGNRKRQEAAVLPDQASPRAVSPSPDPSPAQPASRS